MSLLNIGVTALTANRSALATTAHNISNVHTKGYSRQGVVTEAHPGQNLGTGFIGKGVLVSTVVRHYSDLIGRQANAASALAKANESRFKSLENLQDVFQNGEDGLGRAISSMMDSFVAVQTAPNDATGRTVALTRMTELASRFQAAASLIDEQEYAARQEIKSVGEFVTATAAQIAKLNGQISRAIATGHQPNDLLDSREQLIREVNEKVQVSVVQADHGNVSLFIGGSQPLVIGETSGIVQIDKATQWPGSGREALFFTPPKDGAGNAEDGRIELTAAIVGGGSVAGLLQFANDDLAEGRNLLGRMAMVIGTQLNGLNHQGVTLAGVPGGDLFSVQSRALPGYSDLPGYNATYDAAGNFVPATLEPATVHVTDPTQLRPSDYVLGFDTNSNPKVAWLTRQIDGQMTRVNWPATDDGVTTIAVDGLEFNIPNKTLRTATKVTQSILFSPLRDTAKELNALVHNPDDLAAASMLSANIAKTNRGQLQMSALAMTGQVAVAYTGLTPASSTVAGFDTAAKVQAAVKVTTLTPEARAEDQYKLTIDKVTGTLIIQRASDNAEVRTTLSALDKTGESIIQAWGLRFSLSAEMVNKASGANNTVDLQFKVPAEVAVPAKQAPWAVVFDDASGGYQFGEIDQSVPDAVPPILKNPTVISAGDAGAYVSGQPLIINGWTITLTGTPQSGDFVTVRRSTDMGAGYKLNAGNAAQFLAMRDRAVYDQDTKFTEGFAAALASIGTRTQSAKLGAEFSATVAQNLEADRTAVSGVDKDEEAARLLQYQQAYQASAKVIQIAQSLFDSVLQAVGR